MLARLRSASVPDGLSESTAIVEQVIDELSHADSMSDDERSFTQRRVELLRNALAHDPVTARKLAEMMGLTESL